MLRPRHVRQEDLAEARRGQVSSNAQDCTVPGRCSRPGLGRTRMCCVPLPASPTPTPAPAPNGQQQAGSDSVLGYPPFPLPHR